VTSLEYLHRTGRIGKASVYLGSLLNIKPLLTLNDGVIVPLEKIRGNFQKVADRMIDDLETRFGNQPLLVSIVQGETDEIAAVLEKTAKARLHIVESIPTVAGPIIGAHTGPSLAGIVAIPQQ
ncbi:MAG TPA: DegV family protein, partial [Bacillota bacterium]|nr:DegV family protein [Bacillota bacterium]